jgi:hypothetical protein
MGFDSLNFLWPVQLQPRHRNTCIKLVQVAVDMLAEGSGACQ